MEPLTQECIAKEEMTKFLEQPDKRVLLVDVRSAEEYAAKHIPGAILIPLNELEFRSGLMNKDSFIITVCGKGGGRSAQAADLLKQKGFQAAWLCGGTDGYV